MYDLPSEDPNDPGLPDEYHALQPQFLTRTFRCRRYSPDRVFMGSDMNLYYDVRHSQWYKRPDWFLVVNIPRLYDEVDLRSSYVVWQEGVNPFVVVELLSPGTEKEDLGELADLEMNTDLDGGGDNGSTQTEPPTTPPENGQRSKAMSPRKWTVYEQVLRVPYYIVFSRYTNRLRFFQLVGGQYQEQPLDPDNPRIWITELELELGLWQGTFEGIDRLWLRWYDEQGNWALTDTELEHQRAELEHQRAEAERQRAERAETELANLLERLKTAGIDPDAL